MNLLFNYEFDSELKLFLLLVTFITNGSIVFLDKSGSFQKFFPYLLNSVLYAIVFSAIHSNLNNS